MRLPDGEMDIVALEKSLIIQVMERFDFNQTRAARYMNMSRRALGYRLEKYGLGGDALKSMRGRERPVNTAHST